MNGYPNDFRKKIISDFDALSSLVKGLKAVNFKVVTTIGSWDLLHIGHVRYLNKAKEHGDILIVGVDTDRSIKYYKGPLRPVVPENERCEMLTYQHVVDFVVLVDDVDENGKWQYKLIDIVRPDVFVAVEDSYSKEQLEDIKKYSSDLIVFPRQANETSTSNMIQNTVKKHLEELTKMVDGGRR